MAKGLSDQEKALVEADLVKAAIASAGTQERIRYILECVAFRNEWPVGEDENGVEQFRRVKRDTVKKWAVTQLYSSVPEKILERAVDVDGAHKELRIRLVMDADTHDPNVNADFMERLLRGDFVPESTDDLEDEDDGGTEAGEREAGLGE